MGWPTRTPAAFTAAVLAAAVLTPASAPAVPTSVITVDRLDDVASASACDGNTDDDCSLRGAISFANTHTSTEIDVPKGTYQLTIAGPQEDANQTGDLDLLPGADDVRIIGTDPGAPANTIIKQTTNDRVIHAALAQPPPNQTFGTANWDMTIKGVTIEGGNIDSSQPAGQAAGAGLLLGSTNNTYDIENCIVRDNHNHATLAANGGGIAQSAFGGSGESAGSATVKNCLFEKNTVATGVGGAYRFSGGAGGSLDVQDSTFDDNEATTNEGGAMFLTASGTNTATYSILRSTFTNNRALTSVSTNGGGAIQKSNGTLDVHWSRFFKNSANSGGSGNFALKIGGNNNVDVSNNWWGCNGDPTTPAAGCDVASNAAQTPGMGYTFVVNPRLQLAASANPTSVNIGSTSTVTADFFKDSNGGTVAASNLTAFDGVPITFDNAQKGTLSNKDTAISSGDATATFTGTTAGAGGADATVDGQTKSVAIDVFAQGDLEVSKTETIDPVVAGQGGSPAGQDNLTYTIKVKNKGPDAVSSARVTENMTLPSGVTLGTVTPSQGSFDSSSKIWTVGSLAVNATATMTLGVNVSAATANDAQILNQAVSSFTGLYEIDPVSGNNSATENTTVKQPPTVSPSPTSKDFGDQRVGTSGSEQTFTVTNSGGLNLDISAVGKNGGETGDFDITADNCTGQTVAPAGNCTVKARFSPTATGSRSTNLRISSNDPNTPNKDLALSGNGIQSQLSASPTSKDFGTQLAGTSTAEQTFTVSNPGSAALNIGTITKGGSDPGEFEITEDNCSSQAVAVSGSCTVKARFSPTSAGSRSAALSIPSDAPTTPDSIALSGSGIAPAVSISPTSKNFGAQDPGTSSGEQTFTISNPGSATLNIGTITKGGSDPGEFEITEDNCSSQAVAVSSSCTIKARFSPTTTGSKSASVSVPSDAPTSPDGITLSGNGGQSQLSASPTSASFGSQRTGTSSAAQTFTVSNTGTAPLNVGTITKGGSNPGAFEITEDNCSGQAVAVSGDCTVKARFSPAGTGSKSATLNIPSDAPTSPDNIGLTGTGVASGIAVAPTSKDFGAHATGTHSLGRTFTVSNTGTAPLNVFSVTKSGANPGQFEITSNGCSGHVVAVGSNCALKARFSPTSTGAKSATLNIPSDAPTGTAHIQLHGTGTKPAGPGPPVVRLVCATGTSAKFQWIKHAADCPGKRGKLVHFPGDAPVHACLLKTDRTTSVRASAPPAHKHDVAGMLFLRTSAGCAPDTKAVVLPTVSDIKLCAGKRRGTLRKVASYSVCNALEVRVVLRKL